MTQSMIYYYNNGEYQVTTPKTVKQSSELRDLVERMERVFKTKVQAVGNNEKGRIYIDYFSHDDLDRLVEFIDIYENKQE